MIVPFSQDLSVDQRALVETDRVLDMSSSLKAMGDVQFRSLLTTAVASLVRTSKTRMMYLNVSRAYSKGKDGRLKTLLKMPSCNTARLLHADPCYGHEVCGRKPSQGYHATHCFVGYSFYHHSPS